MQNQTQQKRQRTRKKRTVVAREGGFSIRQMRDDFIVQIRRAGIRESKVFATLDAARMYCQQIKVKRTNEGLAGFNLSAEQRDDATRALTTLNGRASLQAAAQLWSRMNPAADALTVEQLFTLHVSEIKKNNRREKTVQIRRQFLNRFATDYGKKAARSITADDVKQFLEVRVPQKSFNTMRACLGAAFSFAVKQRLVDVNPIAVISPIKVEHAEPVFWPVETVAKIMHAAVALDATRTTTRGAAPITPVFALSAFGGLRPDEAARLDWSNVNLDEALIRIPAAVSKVRRTRLVPMPDNLVRWLLPYRKSTGPVSPSAITIKRGRKAVLKAAKLPPFWPQDVLRHSFATHWMAAHAHEGRLAEMMGNSPAIIQRHYKGLATAKEGAKYFKIEPPAEGNVIQLAASA